MPTYADIIVRTARITRGYLDRQAVGIRPEQFARKATWGLGGLEINTNHAAWTYGHLATYPARVGELIGKKVAGTEFPAAWTDLFKNGSACLDDPRGTIYPPMQELLSTCWRAHDAIIDAAAKLTDAELMKENPSEHYRSRMPLVGDAVSFLLNNHAIFHMGQVSAWRRCMGLPPA